MDKIAEGYGGLTNGILLGTLAVIILIYFWPSILHFLRINIAFWQVPGPLAYPIIGNALLFIGGPQDFFRVLSECRNKYGNMFRLWIGRRPFLFLTGANVVQPVLNSSVHIIKSEEYKCLEPWLGTGLINSTGSKWHSRRKMLTGAFHSTLLEEYVESLDVEARKMAGVLLSHVPKESAGDWSEEINVCHYTKLSALDSTCETIMGYNINALEGDSNQEYVNAIDRVNQILQRRFITPWLLSDFIFYRTSLGKEFNRYVKIIHNFVDGVIMERRKKIAASKKEGDQTESDDSKELLEHPKRKSFLDLLLDLSDNGKVLSDADIREEVNTFMFAGHDTTSAAMNWSLFTLGNHPEAQIRILEEAKSVLEEDGNKKLTLRQIGKMEYLDRFVKEVLRMYPSVPMIGRELDSPIIIDGCTFPPGTPINLSFFLLHRDPMYFPEPNKFNPDRFLPSETAKHHSFAYTPFSAGSRNCIGQKLALLELKIVLIRLMQVLEVKSSRKEEDVILQGEIILNSPDGVFLSFKKR
ncbi:cytochrome P450 4C1-like [Hetaerina americana]|uniref:cytochrome P450 4C1-like n=1 Tax=Hetaerina americana TaxID=62018 RepID=UPI003A7F13CE